MGMLVLIIGASGSGKSASMRNCKGDEWGVLNVEGKRLPFRNNNDLKVINTDDYGKIEQTLVRNTLKAYVVDDSQYLMGNEFFDRAKERGYEKYTDIGVNFRNLIKTVKHYTNDDTIVYLLHHCEVGDDGRYKAKTIGKLLDNHWTLEGSCEIVLMADCSDGEYKFITQGKGYSTAKSPMGMFDEQIPNDLEAVDNSIREYYNLSTREVDTNKKEK